MTEKSKGESEIREALLSLLIDIEAMYEGAELPAEGGQPEEFFGPFQFGRCHRTVSTGTSA